MPESTPEALKHPYIPNTDDERVRMLGVIGVSSVDELFSDVPTGMRNEKLDLPKPLIEPELLSFYKDIAKKNVVAGETPNVISFLGGSAQAHITPAVVSYIMGRGEFQTAYTPYQPEISQGTLEAGFLYQSYIAELTGTTIANSGMYDGASAMAEAALMAARLTGKKDISISNAIRPAIAEVVSIYASGQDIAINTIDLDKNLEAIDENTAAVLVQSPNAYGCIEDIAQIKQRTAESGTKMVVYANPLSMAMFKPPGAFGADIVVGDTQMLGIPTNFGGPYNGYFAANVDKNGMRQMPGRIVGMTKDVDGKRAYTLTLQPREQHIKREKATSNICTSQQLVALGNAVFMTLAGGDGLRKLAELNYHNAHYVADAVKKIAGYKVPHESKPFFNEFSVTSPMPVTEFQQKLMSRDIIAGNDLSGLMENGFTLCVTELHKKRDMDRLVNAMSDIASEKGWE